MTKEEIEIARLRKMIKKNGDCPDCGKYRRWPQWQFGGYNDGSSMCKCKPRLP